MNSKRDIVLIYGFWVIPRSWEHWIERYEQAGHRVLAPAYPGFEVEVEALNADPAPIESVTVPQIIEHLEAVTNAVLHGYRDGASGDLRVVACAGPDRLVVVVRDYGVGMRPHPNSPGLGLGLSVIGRLTTEMNIERPDEGGGTRLRMHFSNNRRAVRRRRRGGGR